MVYHSFEIEMDTEKQRQRRRDDTRLTESRNARSKQLLVVPTESLTNGEGLPGELLSGSEHRRPSWFLDMKYQTCSCTCAKHESTEPESCQTAKMSAIPISLYFFLCFFF